MGFHSPELYYNLGNAADTFLIQGTSTPSGGGWTMVIYEGVDEFGRTEELPPDMEKMTFLSSDMLLRVYF